MSVEELFDKIEPQSPGQEKVKEALASDKDLVGIFGPTGTGKSLLAIAYAISSVVKGRYKRAIISRPVVDVVTGKEFTLMSAPETYRALAGEYLRDILSGFTDFAEVEKLMNAGRLVLADPHFLRGRTFDDSIIIVDDAQSVTPEAIVEIIARLGRNSRLIIAGDPVFQRTSEPGGDGASLAREILIGEESAEVIDLGVKDIVRPGARRGVKLLLELQMRRRPLNDTEKAVLESAKVHAPDADIITIIDLQEAKKRWNITSEHTPDVLIVVKEGHLGRLIGTGGERIQSMEEDTGVRLRAIQHTLDFKEYIRAIHPVSWVHKHVRDVDFVGPNLRIEISSDAVGPMIGQRGAHIKFLDEVFRKLIGVGVYAVEVKEAGGRRRRKR
jgi:phosphate starvation-inducible protein PhoH